MTTTRVRIRLASPPRWPEGPLRVGLQTKRGDVPSPVTPEAGVVLETTVEVRPGRGPRPDLKGACVQGRPGERFLYLSWGVLRDDAFVMFRRLKVYFGPVRRAAWEQAGVTEEQLARGVISTAVEVTAPDGSPLSGTARAVWT